MYALLKCIRGRAARAGRSLCRAPRLQIAEDGPAQLAIESGRGVFVADLRRRTLSRNGRVIAELASIESIHVVREPLRELRERWTIRLRVGAQKRIKIGDSDDWVDACVVAARLLAVAGRPSPGTAGRPRLIGGDDHPIGRYIHPALTTFSAETTRAGAALSRHARLCARLRDNLGVSIYLKQEVAK